MTARTLRNSILTADLVWGMLAMPIAYLMRYGWVWHGPTDRSAAIFIPPLMAALLFWSVMSSWVRLDGFRTGWMFSAVVSQLLLAVLGVMLALFAIAYLLREYISRLTLGYFGLLLFSGFLTIRLIARLILAAPRARAAVRNVVIVGNGPLGCEMAAKIESHPELLRRVVGFLSPGEDAFPTFSLANHGKALSVRTADVAQVLKSHAVDEVVLTVPAPGRPEILDLISRCGRMGIAIGMVPQPYELYLTKPVLLDLDGLPLLQLPVVPFVEGDPKWKRVFDIAMALVLLPVCVPPMLVAAALLKIRKGRAFCSEWRCGKYGEKFAIYRLNSPRRGVELPAYERALQKLSITELPQLFNVLRGEMSLVGPRPEGLDRARHYTDWHRQRLNATPGMTGLAQVYGLRDQHPSEDKTRYDLQYILHRSLFQDISLLVQTAWTLTMRLFDGFDVQSTRDSAPDAIHEIDFKENLIHAHSSQSSAD
jgi:lipopolysaccharide/colanic/teichoic acid biosynthesis glycosyltransferase